MSEFTPGPWIMRVNGCTASIITADGKGVGLCQQVHKPCTIPNARLMASAPRMLDTLKMLLVWYGIGEDAHAATTERMREVIAEAEGR